MLHQIHVPHFDDRHKIYKVKALLMFHRDGFMAFDYLLALLLLVRISLSIIKRNKMFLINKQKTIFLI